MKQSDHSMAPGLLVQEVHHRSMISAAYGNVSVKSCRHRWHHFSNNEIIGCAYDENDTDTIEFLAEDADPREARKTVPSWKILIVDDDRNVHETTLLALTGIKIHGKSLEFLHAYTAKEAYQVLLDNPDTALLLLDVVMETVDAGLKLVNIIRNDLQNSSVRIVLRTGQPGYAPEQLVSNDFVIDGYTTKSKLTRSILVSVLAETLSDGDLPEKMPN